MFYFYGILPLNEGRKEKKQLSKPGFNNFFVEQKLVTFYLNFFTIPADFTCSYYKDLFKECLITRGPVELLLR